MRAFVPPFSHTFTGKLLQPPCRFWRNADDHVLAIAMYSHHSTVVSQKSQRQCQDLVAMESKSWVRGWFVVKIDVRSAMMPGGPTANSCRAGWRRPCNLHPLTATRRRSATLPRPTVANATRRRARISCDWSHCAYCHVPRIACGHYLRWYALKWQEL